MCFHVFPVFRTHRLIGLQLLLIIGLREGLPISLLASGSIHRPSRRLSGFFGYLSLCIQLILTRRHSAIIHHLFFLFIFRTYIIYNRYGYAVSIVHAVNNLTRNHQAFGFSVCHEEWVILASISDRSSVLTDQPPCAAPAPCGLHQPVRAVPAASGWSVVDSTDRSRIDHPFSSRTPM